MSDNNETESQALPNDIDALVQALLPALTPHLNQVINKAVTSQTRRKKVPAADTLSDDQPTSQSESNPELQSLREELEVLKKAKADADRREKEAKQAHLRNETIQQITGHLAEIPAQYRSLVAKEIYSNHVKHKADTTYFRFGQDDVFDLSEGVSRFLESDSGKVYRPAPKVNQYKSPFSASSKSDQPARTKSEAELLSEAANLFLQEGIDLRG